MGVQPIRRIWQPSGAFGMAVAALLPAVVPAFAQDAPPAAAPRQAIAAFQPLPSTSVPQPPPGIGAAKAYAVLQSACARCHQAHRTELPAPAGHLGNILDLAALAREPALVVPGKPDASPLYNKVLDRHLPETMFSGAQARELTETDMEVIRDWIAEMPRDSRTCSRRETIGAAELDGLMTGWLEQLGGEAMQTRFISLAHLYNSCATDQELTAWREAVSKLLNSLSWSAIPARVETIGDKLALLAVKISDLGWVGAHWDRLASREPQGGAPKAPDAVRRAAGAEHPVVRADWLASAATRPPLLHDLLGLPKPLAEVGRIVGGDTTRALDVRLPSVAAIAASGETAGARVVMRQETRHGALWLAEDVTQSPGAGEKGGGEKVAGEPPKAAAGAADGAHPAGPRRLLFNLPNGLLAFAAFAADGKRIDGALPAIGTGGCFSCHTQGLVQPRTETGRGGGVASPVLARGVEDDNFRYRRALVQAGVDPDRTLGGLEIVTALARRYELAVDLERAAGETATPVAEFQSRLENVTGAAQPLARRLLQGRLPRQHFERLLAAIYVKEDRPSSPPAAQLAPAAGIDLGLWSDTPRHRQGDLISFNVTTSAACNLTLINIDTKGRATVLFPNEFEPENAIRPGEVVRVPRDNAPYQLRVSTPGVEGAVALCSPSAKLPEGVAPDYERQRFTVLGNWRNFLSGERAGVNDDPRDMRRPARKRARNSRAEAKSEEKTEAAATEPTARAAISVVVE